MPLRDLPGARWPRFALLAVLAALHIAVLLLPRQILHLHRPEPLALIYLPEPKTRSPPRPEKSSRAPLQSPDRTALPITSPPTEAASAPPKAAPRIDWDNELAITAEHQTQLANAPKPRSLDDHKGHDHQGGVGLNSREAAEFGWDQTAIHRFDTRGEIPIIRLSDRCILPLGPFIPLPMCGFGKKIEPRGDLFEHMRDAPAAAPPP